MRIIGIDPGLNNTGWGIIEQVNSSLSYVACGVIQSPSNLPMAERLLAIDTGLEKIIDIYKPCSAAIEETFINKGGASSLKLGMARGIAFLAPARAGLDVGEYSANHIKKSVVGAGHADKGQIQMMVKVLLPKADFAKADAADALAIAICHAHNFSSSVIAAKAAIYGD
jgi:crossover junction endodeoxyribonuclease RuvC